jgi:hypothetical protein
MMKIYSINDFANRCGYFYNACLDKENFCCNNGYNCRHPQQEETARNPDTGHDVGMCYAWSCPLGFEAEQEDFNDPNINNNGYEECEEGNFIVVDDKEEGEPQQIMAQDISLNRLDEILRAEKDGRLIILPCRNDEIIHAIEISLRIKLNDWQKAYIFGSSSYLMPGRMTGRTTAYMLRLILSSEETPIYLFRQRILREVCDEDHGPIYYDWFKQQLKDIYWILSNPCLKLKLRKIYFSEKECRADADANLKDGEK